MAQVFKLLLDGGFVCGDTESRVTSYAYPTSEHAVLAKRDAAKVAATMLGAERRYGMPHEADYDARMWRKLT